MALLFSLLLLAPALGAATEDDFRCVVCRRVFDSGVNISGRFYCHSHMDVALPKCHHCKQTIKGDYVEVSERAHPICGYCRRAFSHCFLCSLPCDTQSGGLTLVDGRSVCSEHSRSGTKEQADAVRIFQQAREELKETFEGSLSLKTPIKAVTLIDIPGLMRVTGQRAAPTGVSQGKVLGLATIVFVANKTERRLEPSTVHLLDYVPRERMLSVSAHEYAHLWQAENHRNFAGTQAILREGFAEWVAYKMNQRFRREEQLKILHNPDAGLYYQGLLRFLELEKQRGIDGVLDFAKEATSI